MGIDADGRRRRFGDTGLTSVYLIRFDETDGVSWLFGRGGNFNLTDPKRTEMVDPNNAGKYIPVVQQEISCYTGLAYYSKYAACRIANVQTSSTDTPSSISSTALTLNHLAVALKKMKQTPTVILMNHSAGLLLSASIGTATINGTTVSLSGNLPNNYAGIPICYTDSLSCDESAVSLS